MGIDLLPGFIRSHYGGCPILTVGITKKLFIEDI